MLLTADRPTSLDVRVTAPVRPATLVTPDEPALTDRVPSVVVKPLPIVRFLASTWAVRPDW